jgi:hypothetical protein
MFPMLCQIFGRRGEGVARFKVLESGKGAWTFFFFGGGDGCRINEMGEDLFQALQIVIWCRWRKTG